MSAADLKRIQEAAIRDVVRMQEDLGLKIVTDGEYNRGQLAARLPARVFQCRDWLPSKIAVKFHNKEGEREHAPPSLKVQSARLAIRTASLSTISSS